jgi:hypothetical protein
MKRIEYTTKESLDKLRKVDKLYQQNKRLRLVGYKTEEYRKYRKKYPEKVKAQQKLNREFRKGNIKRSPCYKCGEIYKVHAHHPNYCKPLEIIWVCSIHHKELHKK